MYNSNKAILPAAALAASAFVTVCATLAETRTLDDLQGLRPDTQGIQTNAFWDTRLHTAYTVNVVSGANTNTVCTAMRTRTVAASNIGNPGVPNSTVITVR